MNNKRPYGISFTGEISIRFRQSKKNKIKAQSASYQYQIHNFNHLQKGLSSVKKDDIKPICLKYAKDTTQKAQQNLHYNKQYCGTNPQPQSQYESIANFVKQQKQQNNNIKQEILMGIEQPKIYNFTNIKQQNPQFVHQNKIIVSSIKRKQLCGVNKQKLWKCQCGKIYKTQIRLQIHKNLKHRSSTKLTIRQKQTTKYKKTILKTSPSKKATINISNNWEQQVLNIYNKYNSIIPFFINSINSYHLKIYLNLHLNSDLCFYKFYTCLQGQDCKISAIIFIQQIKLFITQQKMMEKIWNLSFANMGLIVNIFYGWLKERLINIKNYETSPQTQVESQNIIQFLIQMFIVFNNWSYIHAECKSLVVKVSKSSLYPLKIVYPIKQTHN